MLPDEVEHVRIAGGAACMAEERDHALVGTGQGRPSEPVQAVLANESAGRPGAVADEVGALGRSRDRGPRILEAAFVSQKPLDRPAVLDRLGAGQVEQHQVIDVTAVPADLEGALDELVDRIEVDERVDLREQVPDRDADRPAVIGEQHHHVDEAPILDLAIDAGPKDLPVDPVEELAHVQLERVAARPRCLQGRLGIVRCGMGAEADPAREGLGDEGPIENRCDQGIDGVLHDKVPERGREDHPRLGLVHHEPVVRARCIDPGVDLRVQRVEVCRQATLEQEAGATARLVPGRGTICGDQRRWAEGLLEKMADALHVT